LPELAKHAETLAEYSENILTKASIDTSDLRSIIIAALFSKICSSHMAIFKLTRMLYSIEAEALVRCNIESLIWMGACCKSESGYRKYIAKDKAELEKMRNITRDKPHIYSQSIRDGIRREWEKLESGEIAPSETPYSAEDAARELDIEAFYAYPYRMHSDAIHTPPAYLFKYFIKHDETNISEINAGPIPTRTQDVLYSSNVTILQAIEWYARFFDMEIASSIMKIAEGYRNKT
jgi:hypothetical protein